MAPGAGERGSREPRPEPSPAVDQQDKQAASHDLASGKLGGSCGDSDPWGVGWTAEPLRTAGRRVGFVAPSRAAGGGAAHLAIVDNSFLG